MAPSTACEVPLLGAKGRLSFHKVIQAGLWFADTILCWLVWWELFQARQAYASALLFCLVIAQICNVLLILFSCTITVSSSRNIFVCPLVPLTPLLLWLTQFRETRVQKSLRFWFGFDYWSLDPPPNSYSSFQFGKGFQM